MNSVHALILNGPNLNLLGLREPEIYGHTGMDAILEALRQEFPQDRIDYVQSNHEGVLIDTLQACDPGMAFVLLNPGGLTHTSVALADAVAAINVPVYEVHLSHPPSRETYRHHSYIASHCRGSISGMGALGYRLAYEGARHAFTQATKEI
ncbi:MAG: type II 3-dehydroquinate dehydratase [Bacteroidota bacterium]